MSTDVNESPKAFNDVNTLEELPSMTAKEAEDKADKPIISKETDPNFQSYEEIQRKARSELDQKFKSDGDDYYFKDRAGLPAMHDSGQKITTVHNDPRAAEATVLLAQAKGWTSLQVTGHPDFKREVWMQAQLKGLEVKGFKPNEQDLKDLDSLMKKNTVSKVIPANGDLPHELRAEPTKAYEGPRVVEGELMEHGQANYQFRSDQKPSYFVTVRGQDNKDTTIWGVDLGRAMSESNVKVGEFTKISYVGNKPVTVEKNDFNEKGQVIGKSQIMVKRNTWSVEKNEVTREVAKQVLRGKNVDQKTIKKIDEAVKQRQAKLAKEGKKTPGVKVYDKNAPSAQKSRQQNIERERQRERQLNRSR